MLCNCLVKTPMSLFLPKLLVLPSVYPTSHVCLKRLESTVKLCVVIIQSATALPGCGVLMLTVLLLLIAEMPEVMIAAERGQAEACSPSEDIPDVITQVHNLLCQLFVLLLAHARLV